MWKNVPLIWNFVFEHVMPCALFNKNSNVDLKGNMESFSSNTENIFPPQQCLSPPNLAGR